MNDTARRLRARDPTMLADLDIALSVANTLGDAARLVGLAGASSLWRLADVAEVRSLITKHSKGRGRPRIEGR